MLRLLKPLLVCCCFGLAVTIGSNVQGDGELDTCLVTFVTDAHNTISVRVDTDLLKNMPEKRFDVVWDAVSFRLNESENSVEAFEKIGVAYLVGKSHIGISLDDNQKAAKSLELISSSDPKLRHAIMLLPKGSEKARTDFAGKGKGDFTDAIRSEVRSKGMVMFPTTVGRTAFATTCACKGFFGGTSGCTSPTCTVSPIGTFCNSNPDCKKTDLTSVCSCQ